MGEYVSNFFFTLVYAFGITVLAFVVIVLLEAVILRIMGWKSIWTALLDSFLMNLAITFFAVFLGLVDVISLSPRGWFMIWGVSVAVEGVLLHIFRQRPAQQTWAASLIANIVSYGMLSYTLSILL